MNDSARKNKRILVTFILAGIGMFAFAFAMIPIYRMLCQVTGLNGKDYRVSDLQQSMPIDKSRTITVRFVATTNETLPWVFRPNNKVVKIHPGEISRISFYAKNKTIHPMTVQAIPSIVPGLAAKYIHKTECFCFKQQTFTAGEEMNMPILFHIDSDLPKNIRNITISYTLFASEMAAASSLQKIGKIH